MAEIRHLSFLWKILISIGRLCTYQFLFDHRTPIAGIAGIIQLVSGPHLVVINKKEKARTYQTEHSFRWSLYVHFKWMPSVLTGWSFGVWKPCSLACVGLLLAPFLILQNPLDWRWTEVGCQAVSDGRGIAQGETFLLLIHIRSYKVLAFNNIATC